MSEINGRWPLVRLGEICEFKYGKSLKAASRTGSGSPVYGSNGIVGFHSETLTKGDAIVVGRKGSFGEVHRSTEPCWPIDTTYFIDENATEADLDWLAYSLKCIGLKDLNRAAAVPGLNREDAYRRMLRLPPLDEQRRIAQILDAADALRAKRLESVATLRALEDVAFYELFGDPAVNPKGWPFGKIQDIVESVRYGTGVPAGGSGEFPVLRMGNLTADGRISLHDLKYMDLEGEDVSRYTVRAGDVLFNRTNSPELVGKAAIYRQPTPAAFAGYLIRVRVTREHNPEYLAAFLNTRYAKQVLRSMCKSIVGMANINAQELQKIAIPIVPLDVQEWFANYVTCVQRERVRLTSHLAQLDSLFSSLQSRAFAGEL